MEFLLAEELIGKPWPLSSDLNGELAKLESGKWIVLIVRRDCPHCQEILDTHFQGDRKHRAGERTAIFIAGDKEWPFTLDKLSIDTNPTGSISWASGEPFVASPAVFLVSDGSATDAADGEYSNSFIAHL